jgi:hypothetical protein
LRRRQQQVLPHQQQAGEQQVLSDQKQVGEQQVRQHQQQVGEQHGAHPAGLRQSQQQAREQDGAQKHSYILVRVRKVSRLKKYFILL